jgi:hypothetical protein
VQHFKKKHKFFEPKQHFKKIYQKKKEKKATFQKKNHNSLNQYAISEIRKKNT